jgi:hypothetical protein
MRRCIHCGDEKPESDFNDEHVLPQAFGRFQSNLVLTCVCQECNQFYGDDIDRKLARDTPEGLSRFYLGVKRPSEFKRQGRGSTTNISFQEGPLKGAAGYFARSPDGTAIGVAPLAHVGFQRAPGEPFEFFPLDGLPTRQELLAKGYAAGHMRMQVWGVADPDRIRAALAPLGVRGFEVTSEEPPLEGQVDVEAVFNISHPEFRAVTKIALNYLAAVTAPEVALMTPFDVARRYARYDERPSERIVHARMNPWVFEGPDGKQLVAHYVCVGAVGEDIVGQVCLFGFTRYTVTLARGGVLFPSSFGHLFDMRTRRAVTMGCALPLEGDARTDEARPEAAHAAD